MLFSSLTLLLAIFLHSSLMVW